MAVAKRNLEEIGESLENMGMNDRPSLLNTEMAKSEDMGNYFRIPADNRDLNYDKYFVEGQEEIAQIDDYHSHNTARLDVEGMKALLKKVITPNL